jgi:hypothetical protein
MIVAPGRLQRLNLSHSICRRAVRYQLERLSDAGLIHRLIKRDLDRLVGQNFFVRRGCTGDHARDDLLVGLAVRCRRSHGSRADERRQYQQQDASFCVVPHTEIPVAHRIRSLVKVIEAETKTPDVYEKFPFWSAISQEP